MGFYRAKNTQVGTLSHHGVTLIDSFKLTDSNVIARVGVNYTLNTIFDNGDRKVILASDGDSIFNDGTLKAILKTQNGDIRVCCNSIMFTESHDGEYVGLNDYEWGTLVLMFEGKIESPNLTLV